MSRLGRRALASAAAVHSVCRRNSNRVDVVMLWQWNAFIALFVLCLLLWSNPSFAAGALAVGVSTDAREGVASGYRMNAPNVDEAKKGAIKSCQRSFGASAAAKQLCNVVATFSDQCFAVAFDPKYSNLTYTWRVAENQKKADLKAVAGCHVLARKNRSDFCIILQGPGHGFNQGCDGSAATDAVSLAYYEQAIKDHPNDATAFLNRGDAYYAKKDDDRAIADYSQAIQLDPNNAYVYKTRANAYRAKDDYDSAIADYTKAIQLDPKDADAYNNRGVAFYYKKDYDSAIADHTQAIQLDPKDAETYKLRGVTYYSKKDYDRAIADYSQTIQLDPKDASAYNNRGAAYYDKKDYDHAIADYSQAISLNPQYAAAYNNRGKAYADKGDNDRAAADRVEVFRLNSGNVTAAAPASAASIADIRNCNVLPQVDVDERIAACTRLIDGSGLQDRNLATRYINRGNAYKEKGNLDRAKADYGEVIRLDSGYVANGYNGRGIAYFDEGDFDRAIADLEQATRLDSKDSSPHNNLGLVYEGKGEYDRAIAEFSEAIRLEPNITQPYSNRGRIWRLKGDLDRALRDQDRAIEINPNSIVAYVDRGDTYRYKNDFNHALADYDSALPFADNNYRDYIPAYAGRGLTFEKMGDLVRARAEFEKALGSKSKFRGSNAGRSLETARAHLAALDSGTPPPVIPAAPTKVTSETSIPTSNVAVPAAVSKVAALQGRRVALVIGNSAYQTVPALANPRKDATAISETLKNVGFEVVTFASDQTREQMINALRNFANEAEKSDWAIVYYAGHGMEVGGVNYLIPIDAKIAVDRDIQFEAVPLVQVLNAADTAKKIKLVMLDACRDNPFKPRQTAAPEVAAASMATAGAPITTRSTNGRGLAEVKVSGATLVVYAAKDGQVALDGEGGNSPFAVAVVQRLATPGVEINKLFRLVRDDVMEATAGRQEPYTYGSLPGKEDFFFVSK